jgi:hypothetical protein
MGNKIIIDEEVLDKLDAEIYQTELNIEKLKEEGGDVNVDLHYQLGKSNTLLKIKQLILENSTTISIDESIEDRAKKYAGIKPDVTVDEEERYYNANTQHYDSFIVGATEQSIISEIKSKELPDNSYNEYLYNLEANEIEEMVKFYKNKNV